MAHPWAAGPTTWSSQWLLGVSPLLPGFAAVKIAPHLAGTMDGVTGSVATPRGPVTVRVTTHSAPMVEVDLPEGTSGVLMISRVLAIRMGAGSVNNSYLSLRMSGCSAVGEGVLVTSAFESVVDQGPLDSDGTRSDVASLKLLSGCTRFLLSALALPPTFGAVPNPFPPPFYPSRLYRDELTSGNWIGTYGQDGYSLFSFGVCACLRVFRL